MTTASRTQKLCQSFPQLCRPSL